MLQDETGSKVGCRGDSAVSKGTTDSGVVMENGNAPTLPAAVPDKLPPLTSESVIESEVTQDGEFKLLNPSDFLSHHTHTQRSNNDALNFYFV